MLKSIQWKIMILVTLIIVSILTVNLVLMNQILNQTSSYSSGLLAAQLNEKVALIGKGVETQVSNITQTSILVAEQIASNPQVVQALKAKDNAALHQLLDSNAEAYKKQLGIDLIWLTRLEDRKAEGQTPIFSCPSNPSFDGFDQLNYSSTNKALDTGTTVSSWEVNEEDGKLQITAPIKENGKVIGAVVVGKQTYKSMLQTISDATDTSSTFFILHNNDYYVMTDVEKDELGSLIYADSHENLKENAKNFADLVKQNPVYQDIKILLDEVKTAAKPVTKVLALNGKPYAVYLIPLMNDKGEVNGILFNRLPGFVASQQQIKDETSAQQRTGYVILLVLFLAGLLASFLISRTISNPIKRIANLLREVADGDLTKQVEHKAKDEIGQLYQSANVMIRSLKSIVEDVNLASSRVAASSEELTASAHESSNASEVIALSVNEVASGAENQFAMVKQSKEAVGGIADHVERINGNVHSVVQSAQSASESAEKGTVIVTNTLKQILAIQEKSNLTQEVISDLNQKSEAIGKIVETMSGLARQTNLLALNASIEAARAGESGRGFTVVAGEIRNLANQSSHFAEQIEAIISDIQTESHRSIDAINQAKSAVEDGVALVRQSGQAFGDVYSSIEIISGEMKEVSGAVTRISGSTTELVNSIASIETISQDAVFHTQNVAASAEQQSASMLEISSTSSELSTMAGQLQTAVSKFKM